MKNNSNILSLPIVFKKWTGKSYAIFSSLGMIIKIGHLSIDTSNQAIKKANSSECILNFSSNGNTNNIIQLFSDEITLLLLLPLLSIIDTISTIFLSFISANNDKINHANKIILNLKYKHVYSNPVANNNVISTGFFM